MAYIRVQNLKIDDEGIVTSGTASICETIYDKNVKGSCKHEVREKLGKILYITEDHKEGVFLSPTRGLVSYNVGKDTFSRVKEDDTRLKGTYDYTKPEVHKVFGDAFLLLELMKKAHVLEVLHEVFPEEGVFRSVIIYVIYTILSDRSGITLDDFVSKSFLSCIVENPDSILEEKALFESLGRYEKREECPFSTKKSDRYFETLIKTIQKYCPSFGESYFVQAVILQSIDIYNPYPNTINPQKENIYYQNKVLMIIDQDTGIPVWFEREKLRDDPWDVYAKINGNANLHDYLINTYKLDTTYFSPKLFDYCIKTDNKFRKAENERKGFIVWVPETEPKQFREIRKKSPSELGEYPYKLVFDMISNKTVAPLTFSRYSHRIVSYKVQLDTFVKDLDSPLYIYLFSDYDLITKWFLPWRVQQKNLTKAGIEVEKWKIGGIVLLSNKSCEPSEIFDEYFRWRNSEEALRKYMGNDTKETFYKTDKNKEDIEVENGKILLACICLTLRQMLADLLHRNRESIFKHDYRHQYIKESDLSKLDREQLYDEVMNKMFGKLQSLMCFERNGRVIIETPNDEVNHIFSDLGIKLSASISLENYISSLTGNKTRL